MDFLVTIDCKFQPTTFIVTFPFTSNAFIDCSQQQVISMTTYDFPMQPEIINNSHQLSIATIDFQKQPITQSVLIDLPMFFPSDKHICHNPVTFKANIDFPLQPVPSK
jgi:hypothetical protein